VLDYELISDKVTSSDPLGHCIFQIRQLNRLAAQLFEAIATSTMICAKITVNDLNLDPNPKSATLGLCPIGDTGTA
jgi:hypothetical protein